MIMGSAIEPIKKGYTFLFEKKKMPTGVVGSVLLFIILVAVFSYSASALKGDLLTMDEIKGRLKGAGGGGSGGIVFPTDDFELAEGGTSFSGNGQEGQDATETFTLDQQNIVNITFVLTWKDEPDATGRHTNAPDQFGLEVLGPNNQTGSTSMTSNTQDSSGGEGMVEVTISVAHEKPDDGIGVGAWEYTVKCGDCGDQKTIISILGIRDRADNGNSWTLTVSYGYYQEISS
jgi:hypothetical protein